MRIEPFFKNECPVIHGKFHYFTRWRDAIRRIYFSAKKESILIKPSFRDAQKLAATLAGGNSKFLKIDHTPHPLRQSVISYFHTKNPHVLERQLKFPFRSSEQYSPISLANHIEIFQNNLSWYKPADIAYIKPESIKASLLNRIEKGTSPFGCIQSFDRLEPADQIKIRSILNSKFASHLPAEILSLLQVSHLSEVK
jgi:hypothetical protein